MREIPGLPKSPLGATICSYGFMRARAQSQTVTSRWVLNMFRRVFATLALAVFGLLAMSGMALAQPEYPAPSVTTSATSAQVAGTSAQVAAVGAQVDDQAAVAYTQSTSLASTGAGFGVGAAIAIGIAVFVVGMALVLLGNRVRKSSH